LLHLVLFEAERTAHRYLLVFCRRRTGRSRNLVLYSRLS
jgi:hypothetical protein